MDKFINFFLLVKPKHFAIYVINEDYQTLFKEEFHYSDKTSDFNLLLLKKFLDKNIFNLEKKLNLYIEDINLIIKHEDFIKINLTLIKNFKNIFNQFDISSNDLSNIKETVLRNNKNYQLIHMLINKFIINRKDFVIQLDENSKENISLEIGMICLKKDTFNSFQEILSNYQISIKNVFSFEYVNSFKNDEIDNISVLAYKLINGLNPNEFAFIKKNPIKIGFFEKFFRFFS